MNLSPQSAGKLAKLLPMLSSDHDGEVIAAVRAMERVLKSEGKSLHDLAGMLSAPPHVNAAKSARKPRQRKQREAASTRPEGGGAVHIEWSRVVELGPRLLACPLNEREREFVFSLCGWAMRMKERFRTTEKQAAWLDVIVATYLGEASNG